MLTKDDIVKNATCTEDIANSVGLGSHILDVNDLRSYVSRCPASHKQVVWVICYRSQAKVYDYRLLAQNNVIRLEITMDYVFSGHLRQTPKDTLQDEFTLVNCILGQVIETSADRVSFHILQSKINRVFRLINALQLHQVWMIKKLSYLDLIDQSLLSIFLTKGCLFAKCFDGNFLLIPQTDSQVNCCEVAFTQSLLGFVEIVEVELVHQYLELMFPFLKVFRDITIKLLGFKVGTEEFESERGPKSFFFWFVLGPKNLKDGIECDHESFFELSVIGGVIED